MRQAGRDLMPEEQRTAGTTRLAVYTFAILAEASDHPRVQGFFDSNAANFAAAEGSDGFIAHSGYPDEPGPASWGEVVYPRFFTGNDEGWTPATLSLWADLDSLAAYVYRGLHGAALTQRRKWFLEPRWPTHALWWVAGDYVPTWAEAVAKHEQLHDQGPSAQVFKLLRAYGPDGRRRQLDRRRIAAKARANAGILQRA